MNDGRETSGGAFRLPGMSRRSSLTAVKWLAVLALLFVVVAIATGLISSGGNSSETNSSAAAAPSTSSAKPTGWGAEKTYLGRYRLLGATEQSYSAPSAT
jgi:preprotein translocase subunit SecG